MSSAAPLDPEPSSGPGPRDAILSRAALLLMTGTAGADQLPTLRDLLGPLVRDAATPPGVRQAVAAAVDLLDQAVSGAAAHEDVCARVAALIEVAMSSAAGSAPNDRSAAGAVRIALPPDALLELLPEFIAETADHLEQAERAVLQLDPTSRDREPLNVIFRAFHTIKGAAGFVGLGQIVTLAHTAESMLSRLRDGALQLTPERTDLILHCIDQTRALLGQTKAAAADTTQVVTGSYEQLLQRLAQQTSCVSADEYAAGGEASSLPEPTVATIDPRGMEQPAVRRERREEGRTLRVRTERLDRLIDLIGELVVAHTMVAQDDSLHPSRHGPLAGKVAHTGKIVRELRELGTSLRMVPLRGLFQKIERLVRELSRTTGKQVELVTEGSDTEIDRNMVDFMTDPLVHMVRNAIDHGIEAADVRSAAGKLVRGTVRLGAWHAGADVVIELQDDGRGLDTDAIFRRAVEQGFVEPDRSLTPAEIWQLTLTPGLSTAGAVTALSGRGVGMDIVRRNIEALRGRIEIASEAGAGTTFRLRLPLSLAITDGMLVRVGGERYILPTAEIQTCFRVAPGTLTQVAGVGELVTWQGATMPVVHLARLFAVAGAVADPAQGVLVVLTAGTGCYALLVDELLGQQQFVAKPMDEGLGDVPGITGTAVLSDGRVGLILDTGKLAGDPAARVAPALAEV
jgi:two-component system, chemotaxis family, sensor kinase CheA